MHKRKILAVAVAGALGLAVTGAALAQEEEGGGVDARGRGANQFSGVTVYGWMYPELTSLSGSGATATATSSSTLGAATVPLNGDLKQRYSVDSANSRIGFRGVESLGGGLSTIWQIESTAAIDQGGTILASRDTYVGFRGGYGTIRLGNMETVYKTQADPLRFFNLASGNFFSTSNIMASRMPFGSAGSSANFHQRRANAILYNSPTVGGVQFSAMYSPDEAPGASGNHINAWLESYGVTYRGGPLYLSLAYEIHNDAFGGSQGAPTAIQNPRDGTGTAPHSSDTSPRFSAMYTVGNTRLSTDIATIEYKETGGATGKFQDYKNTRWNVAWEQRLSSAWRTIVQYSNSAKGTCSLVGGVTCLTDGLNAKMIAVGAEYSLSKLTALFAVYAKLTNGSAATMNNTANVTALSPGEDLTQFAIGVRQGF